MPDVLDLRRADGLDVIAPALALEVVEAPLPLDQQLRRDQAAQRDAVVARPGALDVGEQLRGRPRAPLSGPKIGFSSSASAAASSTRRSRLRLSRRCARPCWARASQKRRNVGKPRVMIHQAAASASSTSRPSPCPRIAMSISSAEDDEERRSRLPPPPPPPPKPPPPPPPLKPAEPPPAAASAPARATSSDQRHQHQRDQQCSAARSHRLPTRSAGCGRPERPDSGLGLGDVLVGVVARAHQRAGRHVLEAELVGGLLERL